jgi:hypothetical protein
MQDHSLLLKTGKKGFEMQFNWLFVLIAGAIIIGFFFSLIRAQNSDSNTSSETQSRQEIDAMLRGSQSSAELQKTIPFAKKVRFSCYDDGISSTSEFYVGDSDVASQYNYKVMFTPAVLDGKEIIMKSSQFKAPFSIMPFLYLTNKDIEYVFIGNSALLDQVYSSLPKNTTKRQKRVADIALYPNNNYDNTVFIVNASDAGNLGALSKFRSSNDYRRVSAVVIDAAGGLSDSYGSVDFYHYESSGFKLDDSVGFIGSEMLLGAVIAHDGGIYHCELSKATKRMNLSISLHKLKIMQYSSGLPSECDDYYSKMLTILNQIQEIISADNPDFAKAFPFIWDLGRLNTLVVQKTECAPLY